MDQEFSDLLWVIYPFPLFKSNMIFSVSSNWMEDSDVCGVGGGVAGKEREKGER
jgi:hypothetical protein